MILDEKILKTLEFDKIIELVKSLCIGDLAKRYFDGYQFQTDIKLLELQLVRTLEMKNSLQSDSPLNVYFYGDISGFLKDLKVEGFVLPIDALKEIDSLIKGVVHLKNYFTEEKRAVFPAIAQLSKRLFVPDEIKNTVDKILDDKGEIRPDASPDLLRISKLIRSKQNEINKEFNAIVVNLKSRGLLSDTVETYRNGRRVLTMPVENKRKIKGIIHDESATGKTVYIEPEKIIGLNNELYDLELEYKKEIYKILKNTSDQLRPYIDVFYENLRLVSQFDIISAKAKLAIEMNASKPMIYANPGIHFVGAYHPLLYLKNKKSGYTTVPFDMKLSKVNRIVVISGPNAGGKSITLKTVGLLQLMTQAGFLIPAKEQSKIGVFNKIFSDIGDQQSLEDDLSTYSFRLKNMKYMLENADERSLILIDEFGSGTDPKIGGAIAEAILKELHKMGSWVVITTHYTNIKIFAFKTKGIVNAAMHFDKEKLMPTYNFVLGKPGSSFAYEIAQNIGLSKKVLNYARFKAGKNIKKIEELLVELQSDKAELEKKLLSLRDKEFNLDKLMTRYENMYKDLDFKKKKLKLEKKQIALMDLNKNSRQIRQIIKEIKENQKLEKAKELAIKLENEKKQLIEESIHIKKQVLGASKDDWKNLKAGDFIKLRNSEIYGKIIKLSKNKAEIETGNMILTVPVTEMKLSKKPIETNSVVGIKTNIQSNVRKFETTIDIRGYSKTEAMDSLHDFFDNALLANATLLKILHGKGNGILRSTVKQISAEYNAVEELWHPPLDQGGDGITYVKLR